MMVITPEVILNKLDNIDREVINGIRNNTKDNDLIGKYRESIRDIKGELGIDIHSDLNLLFSIIESDYTDNGEIPSLVNNKEVINSENINGKIVSFKGGYSNLNYINTVLDGYKVGTILDHRVKELTIDIINNLKECNQTINDLPDIDNTGVESINTLLFSCMFSTFMTYTSNTDKEVSYYFIGLYHGVEYTIKMQIQN